MELTDAMKEFKWIMLRGLENAEAAFGCVEQNGCLSPDEFELSMMALILQEDDSLEKEEAYHRKNDFYIKVVDTTVFDVSFCDAKKWVNKNLFKFVRCDMAIPSDVVVKKNREMMFFVAALLEMNKQCTAKRGERDYVKIFSNIACLNSHIFLILNMNLCYCYLININDKLASEMRILTENFTGFITEIAASRKNMAIDDRECEYQRCCQRIFQEFFCNGKRVKIEERFTGIEQESIDFDSRMSYPTHLALLCRVLERLQEINEQEIIYNDVIKTAFNNYLACLRQVVGDEERSLTLQSLGKDQEEKIKKANNINKLIEVITDYCKEHKIFLVKKD